MNLEVGANRVGAQSMARGVLTANTSQLNLSAFCQIPYSSRDCRADSGRSDRRNLDGRCVSHQIGRSLL